MLNYGHEKEADGTLHPTDGREARKGEIQDEIGRDDLDQGLPHAFEAWFPRKE